jgi:hypothetical protein
MTTADTKLAPTARQLEKARTALGAEASDEAVAELAQTYIRTRTVATPVAEQPVDEQPADEQPARKARKPKASPEEDHSSL